MAVSFQNSFQSQSSVTIVIVINVVMPGGFSGEDLSNCPITLQN